NLIQAQILLEKVSQSSGQGSTAITQIRRMKNLLGKRQKMEVERYLSEAERLIQAKDWPAASASLDAAANFRVNDPRIGELQERIAQAQLPRETQPVIDPSHQTAYIDPQQFPVGAIVDVQNQATVYQEAWTEQTQITPAADPAELEIARKEHFSQTLERARTSYD